MSTGDKARSGRRTDIAQRGTIVKKEEAPTGDGASSSGVVTLSQTERNLPTIANVDSKDFKDLACW
jgi:hypothetical protein